MQPDMPRLLEPWEAAEIVPWKQLPGETDHHYSLFLVYLNLVPHERTYEQAYARAYPERVARRKKSPKSTSWYRALAARNRWRPRAHLWDIYVLEEERRTYLEELKKLAVARLDATRVLLYTGLQGLKQVDVRNLTPDEARHLLSAWVDMVVAGLREQRHEVQPVVAHHDVTLHSGARVQGEELSRVELESIVSRAVLAGAIRVTGFSDSTSAEAIDE